MDKLWTCDDHINLLGCGGTAVNIETIDDVFRPFELAIESLAHWFICPLRGNALNPLHLLLSLDGTTTGSSFFLDQSARPAPERWLKIVARLRLVYISTEASSDALKDFVQCVSLWGVWCRTTAQFVSETSVVGVNNAGRTANPFRRFFWCCLFLAGLAVTLNDVTNLLKKYFQYPVTTDFTIDYQDSVTFPAVTICNQNSVMCSKLLHRLFELPDSAPLQKVITLSSCMDTLEIGCLVLHTLVYLYEFIPDFIRDSPCYANTIENCCQLEQSAAAAILNSSVVMRLLDCECPSQDYKVDADQEAEQSQDYKTDADQEVASSQDYETGAGQETASSQEYEAGADQEAAPKGQARRRRNALDLAASFPTEWRTLKAAMVERSARRRREAPYSDASYTEASYTDAGDINWFDTGMGQDEIYDSDMDFYASFMNLTEDIRKSVGQPFEEFIRSCSYNGRDCLNKDFFRQISTASYGNCYVFNGNISGTADRAAGHRNTTLTGANYGLKLVLYLDASDYMRSTVSQTVGARVTIHSSDVFPLVDEAGMDIAPASVNSISLKETRIIRQEHPYQSNCYRRWSQVEVEPVMFDEETGASSPTGERFTLPGCHRICLQLQIVRACGCHHTLYPLTFTAKGRRQAIGEACDLSYNSLDNNCTEAVVNSMSTDASSTDCGCSASCDERDHQPQLSVASWPQGNFLTSILERIAFASTSDSLSEEAMLQWALQFSKLNVYYRDISSDVIEESPIYTYTTLIGSLGGALSLYLGIALILLVEILEYLFFMAVNTLLFMCGRREDTGQKNSTGK
ncbi:uncharacterized protein LOC119092156 [Pollicipes pollicipes]|uniref:uncharacterized protein LOC119092156 n=1 Tax=Pollicipes pollicipes TaxID=41117 RepID=UPI001884B990|nr:uncharacterized protein LOC119092156 [Pollicipes pollicipes]